MGAGHGICLLPRYTARASARRGLVLRPLADVKASRSIVALARQEVAARTTIRGVLDMLESEAAALARELDGSGPVAPGAGGA